MARLIRLLSRAVRGEAFRVGELAYLAGETWKHPNLANVEVAVDAEEEWLEAYYLGVANGFRRTTRARRCAGCSGCRADERHMTLAAMMEEPVGGMYRRSLDRLDTDTLDYLMRADIAKYHKPRESLHVTDVHMGPTPRGKATDRSGRAVEYTVKDGVKQKKFPTVDEQWKAHQEVRRVRLVARVSDSEALRAHREARAAKV